MRNEFWLASLEAYLASKMYQPFEWGVHDCALFAAGAIQAMTGMDVASSYRGKYSDESGAYEVLEKVTGIKNATVEDAMSVASSYYNCIRPIPPLQAQRGDIVSYEHEGKPTLGVVGVNGTYAYFVSDKDTLLKLKIGHCNQAWSVR